MINLEGIKADFLKTRALRRERDVWSLQTATDYIIEEVDELSPQDISDVVKCAQKLIQAMAEREDREMINLERVFENLKLRVEKIAKEEENGPTIETIC